MTRRRSLAFRIAEVCENIEEYANVLQSRVIQEPIGDPREKAYDAGKRDGLREVARNIRAALKVKK